MWVSVHFLSGISFGLGIKRTGECSNRASDRKTIFSKKSRWLTKPQPAVTDVTGIGNALKENCVQSPATSKSDRETEYTVVVYAGFKVSIIMNIIRC